MAITAMSGAELEERGIDSIQDLSFAVPGLTIEILNWAVELSSEPLALTQYPKPATARQAQPSGHRSILCEVTDAWRRADIYDRSALAPGDHLAGPALIIEPQTTTFVSAD